MNKNYFSYEGCVFDNETFNIKSNGKSFFSPIPIFYKPKIEKKLFICIPRSKKDIGALKKGQSALKRGQLKKCQI